MKIYYMRDNHTFRPLPENLADFLITLADEFIAGYKHGMLCTKSIPIEPLHATGNWMAFVRQAKEWLEQALAWQEPEDLEYNSWLEELRAPMGGWSL